MVASLVVAIMRSEVKTMLEAWREKVEKDLGGVPFERALVTELAGALRIEPLYGPTTSATSPRVARTSAIALGAMRVAGRDEALDSSTPAPDALTPDAARWIVGSPSEQGDPASVREWHADGATQVRQGARTVVHALDVHDAGGSIPLELAVCVGRALDAARAGDPNAAVAVAVGTELFVETAKLRALRILLERATTALGRTTPLRILARTSLVGFSRIEPETNALRATLSVVASMLGGADLVACAPYDVLHAADAQTHARAARLASTTGLVAQLESHLTVTDDPLRGAYFVESLTSQMIDAAWAIVRELEANGGASAASERWRARLADEAASRRKLARVGKLPRVGATKLARVDAPMLGPTDPALSHVLRDAEPFEGLRDERIARPATVLVLGEPKKTAARAAYLRETLACWGAATERASLASVDAPVGDVTGTLTDAIVICAEDGDFPRLAPLVSALRARGAVMIAGKPGPHEAALREAGACTFVHLGADLVATARAFFGGAA